MLAHYNGEPVTVPDRYPRFDLGDPDDGDLGDEIIDDMQREAWEAYEAALDEERGQPAPGGARSRVLSDVVDPDDLPFD